MKKTTKKFFSLFIALLLIFSLLPINVNTQIVKANSLENTEKIDNLEAAKTALNSKGMTVPVFGQDTNIITVMQNYLAEKGYTDITVSIADPADIEGKTFADYAQIKQDGTLEYFYVDPSNYFEANTGLANFAVAFTLTKGTESVKTDPLTVQLKWDEDKVKTYLEKNEISQLNFTEQIAPNTDLNQVTQNFELPYYTANKHCTITWLSENSAVSVGEKKSEYSNGQIRDFYPITVKQSAEDQNVNLIATFTFNRGSSNITLNKTYTFTIPGIDLTAIQAEMQNDIDNYFTPYVLKYFDSNGDVIFDSENILYDIQLPTPGSIRRDTKKDDVIVSKGIKDLFKKYKTSGSGFSFYSFENPENANEAGITRNGYKASVILPKAGEKPIVVNMTMTLTHKEYDLSVQKTLPLILNPVDYEVLMAKVERNAKLMQLAKENFFDILNSNPEKIGENQENKNLSPDQVKFNLSSFAEVRFQNFDDSTDKTLEYIYDRNEVKGDGVVLTPLPNWENQEAWRLLKSSKPRFLTHENLLVTQPQYDTDVTIEAMLSMPSMEQYKDYFPAGTDTADAKKLASLFNQPIRQELVILGKDGQAPEDYSDTINATLMIEGSKLLKDKSEQATAHEEWFSKSLEISRDTAFIDFVYDTLSTDANLENLDMDISSGWLKTIDFKNFEANTTGQTNGPSSSWMWYVKHKDSEDFELVSSLDRKDQAAYLQDGDTLKLKFINDPRYPFNIQAQTPENPIELKDDVDIKGWTGFRGDAQNQTAVREVEKVVSAIRAENWNYINTNMSEWGFPTAISDLISINNNTFYATADQLVKLDETGKAVNSLTLAGNIEYFSRLAYGRGMLIVPLQGGGVQAVDPETMISLWVVESLDSFEKWEENQDTGKWEQKFYNIQSLGTTYVDLNKGIAYIPLTANGSGSTEAGILRAIDLATGKELWRYSNTGTGYYWGGATAVDNYLLIGNDLGQIEVISQDGKLKKTSDSYGSSIRSTLVQQNGKIYFTSTDGVFHSIKFDAKSLTFTEHQTVKFAMASTSTPTIHAGKAYVGGLGGNGSWGDPGVFALIDLTTMQIESKTDNLAGEVKSAPLVIYDQKGEVYAYFTANTQDGLLYVYHNGSVELAYRPTAEQAQYTTATPIIDAAGNIYYTTDQAIISLAADKQAALNEYTLNYQADTAVGQISGTILGDAELTRHSTFKILDATDNIKMLYDTEIKAQIDNADYVSFQSRFIGAADKNPEVLIQLQIAKNYLPLEKNQTYQLYRLDGTVLTKYPSEKVTASLSSGKHMAIMPILAAALNEQSAAGFQFKQNLQDSQTYILAAVHKSSSANQPTENSDITNTNVTQTQKNQPKQVVKTGESGYVIPMMTLLGLAVIGYISKKLWKEQIKNK